MNYDLQSLILKNFFNICLDCHIPGIEYLGGEDIDIIPNVFSPEQCRELCESHHECQYWTHSLFLDGNWNSCLRKRTIGSSVLAEILQHLDRKHVKVKNKKTNLNSY